MWAGASPSRRLVGSTDGLLISYDYLGVLVDKLQVPVYNWEFHGAEMGDGVVYIDALL